MEYNVSFCLELHGVDEERMLWLRHAIWCNSNSMPVMRYRYSPVINAWYEQMSREEELPGDWNAETSTMTFNHANLQFIRPYQLAHVLQIYLEVFEPESVIALEVAQTVDPVVPDGYGGIAYFITASGVQAMSTNIWIEERLREKWSV